MARESIGKWRIWFIELINDDAELQYHVRLTTEQAEETKDKLQGLVHENRVRAFRMSPAEEVAIPIASFRKRLGIDR